MDMIKVNKRDFGMKAKKLRSSGLIPGSVFGGPLEEAISLQIEEPVARKLIATMRTGSRMKLELDGKVIPVQIKEIVVNTLNNVIQHINFQALKADQKVNSVIHILLHNTDKVPGTLEHMLTDIPYAALPADMIDTITIDLDGMPVGTSITVGDIKELQNDKLDLQVSPEEMVLRIFENKTAAAETESEEAAEPNA